MTFRQWAIAASTALGVAGCTLGKPSVPSLSGPSVMSLSLVVTASPALLARGDSTPSVITVMARDANAQPIPNLGLRMDLKVGGVLSDLGTLSAHNVFTGANGTASVTYTAPPVAGFGITNEATVQVVATALGSDYANATGSAVSVRLVSPGVIQPSGILVPTFAYLPQKPRVFDVVKFLGVVELPPGRQIVSWKWDFGDGETKTTTTSDTTHDYVVDKTYLVTLTVTDNLERTGTVTLALTIYP